MTRKLVAVPLLALALAVPAEAAGTMKLHQFVERGTKLEKKGPLALLHRDEIRLLQEEMQAASTKVRNERLAAEKAGRKGAYCPPPGGSGGMQMNAKQLLKELRTISASQPRSATVADGMRVMLARRYPCPA